VYTIVQVVHAHIMWFALEQASRQRAAVSPLRWALNVHTPPGVKALVDLVVDGRPNCVRLLQQAITAVCNAAYSSAFDQQ
jgi:hypothetical protein